jgi:thiamine biosynthesis protein ThiS
MSDTIEIIVNGAPHTVASDMTVDGLLARLDLPRERIAIELNRRIVRKAEWARARLAAGDHLEIVHFVGGG